MPIKPNFTRLKSFEDRSTADLENNIKDAIDEIAITAMPRLKPVSKIANYIANADELVITNGTFQVTLPNAQAVNGGTCVGVIHQSGTITVAVITGAVQGAVTEALTTPGLYLYVSTGVKWWRTPSGAGGSGTPAVSVTSETTFGIAPVVGVNTNYARQDHTHGSPPTPVTSIAADDATLVFSAATGAVTAHVGVITDVNVDETIVTDADLSESVSLLAHLVEAMEDEVALLKNIDINLAEYANELPAELKDTNVL